MTLTVYTITGKKVTTLVSKRQKEERYEVTWNGGGLATGSYLYRLEADGVTKTRQALLVR